jgi:pSer/pThr/pTyr-binding forkhead associated (FHA) protein
LKGNDRPLTPSATLVQLDIQPQDELLFNYVKQANRQMLDPHNYAFLKDESTNRVYEIQWQPAIIGRPTNEAEHNIMLAVNLQLHPKGQTVSRRHAQITFSQGSFYIETLADNNPLAVNGKEVPVNARKEIKNGDRITIGRSNLPMTFNTQTPATRESRSQPAYQAPPAPTPAPAPRPQPLYQSPAPPPVAPAPAPAPVYSQPAPAPIEEDKTYIAPSVLAGRLVVERALMMNKTGQTLDLTSYPCQLGRDLPILTGEGEISRRHAEINFDASTNKFTVTDLQSTNGVTIDGVRIEPNRPYELRPGARLGLGAHFVFRFEL